MSFLREIKRRKVFQVAAVYTVVAWLAVQVITSIEGPLGLPDWVDTLVIVLLAVGFPIAVILAWAFDLAPEGVVRDKGSTVAGQRGGRKIEYVLIGLLFVAVGWIGFREFNPAASSSDVLPNSIAVIPFRNDSPDSDNAYYASGIHEEILNQLAKLSALSVIARTSVEPYAGTDKSIPEIARELNVETVMEGSVRFANNQIRVTAQLIDPETGLHLWSETYERDFENVFAVESDIAMNVANAMAVEFSSEEQAAIEERPTESTEAYALYLATIGHIRKADPQGAEMCLATISRALEIDRSFVLGWQTKAECHGLRSVYLGGVQEELELAMQANLHALELDPEFAPAHAAIAYNLAGTGQWQEAERKFQEALSFGLNQYEYDIGGMRYRTGRLAEARQFAIATYQRDPLDSNVAFRVMDLHEMLGDRNDADRIYERGLALYDAWPAGHFHRLVALLGRGNQSEVREFDNWDVAPSSEIVQYIDEPRAALARLREYYAADAPGGFGLRLQVSAWAAYFGDHELALDALKNATNAAMALVAFFWMPLYEDVRQLPGFKEYMREIGLVDYWQEFGWPDLCEPTSEQDFECH